MSGERIGMAGLAGALSSMADRAEVRAARNARPMRDGLILVGLARAAYYFFVQGIQPWTFLGVDARAYWQVDLAHPYANSGVGEVSTYLYSPAFAQVMAPFSLLPFEVFFVLWTAVLLVTLAWLVRPWPWALLILALPIIYELCVGNVHFLIASCVVLGLERTWTWSLPVLTKITPGVGLGWLIVRREWRAFATALGVLAGIVVASFVVSPSAWLDWVAFLAASPGRSELLIPRLVVAALLVVLGAATGRRWLVPVAVWLALPVVWINSWVILLAVIRLRHRMPPAAGTTPSGSVVPVTERTTAP